MTALVLPGQPLPAEFKQLQPGHGCYTSKDGVLRASVVGYPKTTDGVVNVRTGRPDTSALPEIGAIVSTSRRPEEAYLIPILPASGYGRRQSTDATTSNIDYDSSKQPTNTSIIGGLCGSDTRIRCQSHRKRQGQDWGIVQAWRHGQSSCCKCLALLVVFRSVLICRQPAITRRRKIILPINSGQTPRRHCGNVGSREPAVSGIVAGDGG